MNTILIGTLVIPNDKIIDPTTDKDAHKTARGDYMCGVCTIKNLYKMNKGTVEG
jgi:hypothetical protein